MSNDTTDPQLRYDTPAKIGWYATLHTWDPLEGLFPGAHYWDGKLWRTELGGVLSGTRASVSYWPIVFESREEAEVYADEHDPENK